MGRSRRRLTFVGAFIAASTLAVGAIGAYGAASNHSGTRISTANSGTTAIGTDLATRAAKAARTGAHKQVPPETDPRPPLSTRAAKAAPPRSAPPHAPSALGSIGGRVPHAAPPCGPKKILIVYSDTGPPNQLVAACSESKT